MLGVVAIGTRRKLSWVWQLVVSCNVRRNDSQHPGPLRNYVSFQGIYTLWGPTSSSLGENLRKQSRNALKTEKIWTCVSCRIKLCHHQKTNNSCPINLKRYRFIRGPLLVSLGLFPALLAPSPPLSRLLLCLLDLPLSSSHSLSILQGPVEFAPSTERQQSHCSRDSHNSTHK